MTIAIELPDDIRARLLQKATQAGVDVTTYAARVLEVEAMRVPLEERLRPVRRAFAESGLTSEELTERLEQEKHAARETSRGVAFRE